MSVITRTFVVFCLISLCFASSRAAASLLTIGPDGINSAGLTLANGVTPLDGSGIGIGQVEHSRPAKMGTDAANDLNSTVKPTAVFRQDGSPTAADLITAGANPVDRDAKHAMQVAGILISTDPLAMGVAPGASLYSSAHVTSFSTVASDADLTMRAIQQVATQSNVRAVNHSYFKRIGSQPSDGNDLLSAGLDWSATEHNVLHVTSNNNQGFPGVSPKANFNGMVIASSALATSTGKYQDYASLNLNIPLVGGRTAIDLIAPGIDVQSTLPNNMLTPTVPNSNLIDDGASFAAPHVTGTVALLQQFGDDRNGAANWTGTVASGPTSQRHEVMKAVLMNSADKVKGVLGMERDVRKNFGDTWFDTDASMQQFTPLDVEIGAGHLNANRALAQFAPGEHEPGNSTTVPNRAWDYSTSASPGTETRYRLETPLAAGEHIQVTLAWDRIVDLDMDGGATGVFDVNDTFTTYTDIEEVLSDLDVFLVERDADIGEWLTGSTSVASSVEHFLYTVTTPGLYDIIVDHTLDNLFPSLGPQDFAIAWWAGPDTVITNPLTADFNADGDVDAADLAQWQGDFGINGDSDADNDGDTDGADFLAWQRNFGATSLSASTAVPEPSSLLLLVFGLPLLLSRRGKV